MSVTLGPLASLEDNLVLRGLDADKVAVEEQRSDEGVSQLLITDLDGGRKLGLYGWHTYENEEAALDLSVGGAPQLLTHPRFTGMVTIIGTSMEDLFEYVDPLPTDWRVGTIHLIEA